MVTGSHDILLALLQQGQRYLQASQCSLNKALEKVCLAFTRTFGYGLHKRFWRIAKGLCEGAIRGEEVRRPHPYAPCMMSDLAIVDAHGSAAWVISRESWIPSPRPWMDPKDDQEDQRRAMNFRIVEAVTHHQIEHPNVWKHVPDYNPIFMALAFARRAVTNHFSAETASHIASIAVRYEVDESRTGSAAFKGLRRWRNVSPEVVTELTIKCVWGHKETPRHHQLWHLHRIVNDRGLHEMRSTLQEAKFLLLVAVVNDHVFASIPPEDAAECVVNALFTKYALTPKQRFDVSRIVHAVQQPRSPYLHILFPNEASIPIETWIEKLSIQPTAPEKPQPARHGR